MQSLERFRREHVRDEGLQTDKQPVSFSPHLSPLSVTDCERPPITLIVSSQSLKEQYNKDLKNEQKKL